MSAQPSSVTDGTAAAYERGRAFAQEFGKRNGKPLGFKASKETVQLAKELQAFVGDGIGDRTDPFYEKVAEILVRAIRHDASSDAQATAMAEMMFRGLVEFVTAEQKRILAPTEKFLDATKRYFDSRRPVARVFTYEPEPGMPFDPALYECKACSVKPGSPTLCARCLAARSAAPHTWKGQLPVWARTGQAIDTAFETIRASKGAQGKVAAKPKRVERKSKRKH